MVTSAATNTRVAVDIGLNHSSISRIRSGIRHPSIDVMIRIQNKYKWSVQSQVEARANNEYAKHFEQILVDYYGTLDEDE